jgi:hypothetical protein
MYYRSDRPVLPRDPIQSRAKKISNKAYLPVRRSSGEKEDVEVEEGRTG